MTTTPDPVTLEGFLAQAVSDVINTVTEEPAPFTTCPWLVQVPSGHPEPDSYADTVMVVECGAPVTFTHGGEGWRCESGHEHLPIEIALAPGGPEWQRESRERFDETGRVF